MKSEATNWNGVPNVSKLTIVPWSVSWSTGQDTNQTVFLLTRRYITCFMLVLWIFSRLHPASLDYGFDNVEKYHNDFQTDDGYTAGQILLGLFQCIRREVGCSEFPGASFPALNTFGASKKMIVKAYKTNGLDDFLHRYIRNVINNYGKQSPGYCFMWLKNKLVIGPTQLTLNKMERLTEDKILEMRNEIFLKYYSD